MAASDIYHLWPSIDIYFSKLVSPFGALGNDIENWNVLGSDSAKRCSLILDCEDLSKSKQEEK